MSNNNKHATTSSRLPSKSWGVNNKNKNHSNNSPCFELDSTSISSYTRSTGDEMTGSEKRIIEHDSSNNNINKSNENPSSSSNPRKSRNIEEQRQLKMTTSNNMNNMNDNNNSIDDTAAIWKTYEHLHQYTPFCSDNASSKKESKDGDEAMELLNTLLSSLHNPSTGSNHGSKQQQKEESLFSKNYPNKSKILQRDNKNKQQNINHKINNNTNSNSNYTTPLEITPNLLSLLETDCYKTKTNNNPIRDNNNLNSLYTIPPQDYLDTMIFQRGYSTKRYKTLYSGYYNEPTSLDQHILNLVDTNCVIELRTLLTQCGLSINPSNYFGSTLIHYVCSVGNIECFIMLLEIGCDIRIANSMGRTPLHDACKPGSINDGINGKHNHNICFQIIEYIMKHDIRLFYMEDNYGKLPLERIMKHHWTTFNNFLNKKKDIYWPIRNYAKYGEEPSPPLTLISPNTRILPDPKVMILLNNNDYNDMNDKDDDDSSDDSMMLCYLEKIRLVASGNIHPSELTMTSTLSSEQQQYKDNGKKQQQYQDIRQQQQQYNTDCNEKKQMVITQYKGRNDNEKKMMTEDNEMMILKAMNHQLPLTTKFMKRGSELSSMLCNTISTADETGDDSYHYRDDGAISVKNTIRKAVYGMSVEDNNNNNKNNGTIIRNSSNNIGVGKSKEISLQKTNVSLQNNQFKNECNNNYIMLDHHYHRNLGIFPRNYNNNDNQRTERIESSLFAQNKKKNDTNNIPSFIDTKRHETTKGMINGLQRQKMNNIDGDNISYSSLEDSIDDNNDVGNWRTKKVLMMQQQEQEKLRQQEQQQQSRQRRSTTRRIRQPRRTATTNRDEQHNVDVNQSYNNNNKTSSRSFSPRKKKSSSKQFSMERVLV